jgi:hemerythrin-like domain-containing protein
MSSKKQIEDLSLAIKNGPFEQQALLKEVDLTYAYIDLEEEHINDEDLLTLKILLAQAETLLSRYFGS